jgi:hypothetical protein
MKKAQGYAAGFFIFAVAVLGIISILGVWQVFNSDVIGKSFESIGLLAFVAIIVIAACRYLDAKTEGVIYVPNPGWKGLRKGTAGILIASVSVLALMGILAIWDVITDKQVLYKSLSSVAILAFVAFVIVLTCLAMEHDPSLSQDGQKKGPSAGQVVGYVILGIFLLWLLVFFVGVASSSYM